MTEVIARDQQSWLEAVLNLLPMPALLIEPGSARILFANVSAASLPAGALAGEDAQAEDERGDPIPPGQWPHQRAAAGETLDRVQVSWATETGRSTYLASSGTVLAMFGHPAMAVLTLVDVTPLKAAEDELRRAIEARDEFFSFATHELKDPLSSLLLSVEVLRRMTRKQGTIPADVLLQRLDVSKRQGERLAGMIENLLDVARIHNDRVQPDLEALDLCELAHDVVARFQESARESGTSLAVEPCPPTIGYFDRMLLEHVVGNLVSNALKYGAGRPVVVRLGGDDETAVLEVEDHGTGIAEADLGRVFERFERAASGHREKSLGLGLYIVRNLVESHGGTIGVRSTLGVGSTFTVRLPRKRLPHSESAPTPRD